MLIVAVLISWLFTHSNLEMAASLKLAFSSANSDVFHEFTIWIRLSVPSFASDEYKPEDEIEGKIDR